MASKLVLVDGKNYCYRMHWVHRFLSSHGRCTSLLFGGFNSMVAMARQLQDTAFCFVWDGEGSTWRHKFSNGEYKAHRQGRTANDDMAPLFPQIPIFCKALTDAGFRCFKIDGLECDDLIGMLATAAIEQDMFQKVIIHSTDQDFYQLVTDRIAVMRGKAKGEDYYQVKTPDDIFEEIGLPPKDWVKIRALIGDTTDNIPHPLEGVGIKTAIKMVHAGVDASVEEFDKLSFKTRSEFSPIKPRWKIIRSNYVLSQIMRVPNHPHIDSSVKKKLMMLLAGLTTKSFHRDRRKLNDGCFSTFTEFIAEYELSELFANRIQVWKLP